MGKLQKLQGSQELGSAERKCVAAIMVKWTKSTWKCNLFASHRRQSWFGCYRVVMSFQALYEQWLELFMDW